MNIGSLHPQPTCRCVPEVMEPEVLHLRLAADSRKGDAHLLTCIVREQAILGFGLSVEWQGPQHASRQFIQVTHPASRNLRGLDSLSRIDRNDLPLYGKAKHVL